MRSIKKHFFPVLFFCVICCFSFFSALDKFLPELCLYWTFLLLFEKKWYARIGKMLKTEICAKYFLYLCVIFSFLCFVVPIIHYFFFDANLFVEKKYLSYAWLILLICGTNKKYLLNNYVLFFFILGCVIITFPKFILFYKTGLISSSLCPGQHPSFISLKLILGLLFLIYLQFELKRKIYFYFFSVPIFFLFLIVLYALQARITVLIISFLLISFPFYYYSKYKKKILFPVFFVFFLLFFFSAEHFYIRKISINDARPQLWESSLSTIFSSTKNLILGLGEIEGIKKLNYNYKLNPLLPSSLKRGGFGTHNIFLTYWLNFGVFVLLLNFCIWILGFFVAIKKKNFLLFSILTTFLAIFFVDSHHLYFTKTHYMFCFFYFLFFIRTFFLGGETNVE